MIFVVIQAPTAPSGARACTIRPIREAYQCTRTRRHGLHFWQRNCNMTSTRSFDTQRGLGKQNRPWLGSTLNDTIITTQKCIIDATNLYVRDTKDGCWQPPRASIPKAPSSWMEYLYMCIMMYTYNDISIYRRRERDGETHIYIYIYI